MWQVQHALHTKPLVYPGDVETGRILQHVPQDRVKLLGYYLDV